MCVVFNDSSVDENDISFGNILGERSYLMKISFHSYIINKQKEDYSLTRFVTISVKRPFAVELHDFTYSEAIFTKLVCNLT